MIHLVEILIAGTALLGSTGFVFWKNQRTNKQFQRSLGEVRNLQDQFNRFLEDRTAANQALAYYQTFANQRHGALENRHTSIENRQTALENRQSDIEGNHRALVAEHKTIHTAQDLLRTQQESLRVDFDTISKKITEKSQPVYVQNSDGAAVCSKCGFTVKRYFHDGPSVVCANCDSSAYTRLTQK